MNYTSVGDSDNSRGGGGGGGMNYVGNTTPNPGFTYPSNSRPAGRQDGYVVITYMGPSV
jgi:hypothetical protein